MDTDDRNPWEQWERNFIAHMARLREARGMTQTDLAKAVKVYGPKFHQQTVQRIEAGERPVRLDEAHLIAKALDVSVDSMTSRVTMGNDELLFIVDRMRREAGELAHEIRETLARWADLADNFVVTVDDLNPEKGDKSPLVRWSLEWCSRFNQITARLHDALSEAHEVAGHTAMESEMTIVSMEIVNAWSESMTIGFDKDFDLTGDELVAWIRDNRG